MKPRQIKAFLADALEDPTIQPVLITGAPGIGKSSMPKEVTTEKHVGFIDVRLAQRDPTDMRGVPAVIDNTARWLPPSDLPTDHYCMVCKKPLQMVFLENIKDKTDVIGPVQSGSLNLKREMETGKWKAVCPICGSDDLTDAGILMLDEITSCPPLVQASAYQITLDRAIGEYKLPDKWYVMGAGNRIQDRSVVRPMSKALANRFTHIDFEINLDDWVEWALRKGLDSTLVAFINFRPELLFQFNPESSEEAFPTPRSWEFVDNLLNSVSNENLIPELIKGTVGKGAQAEFSSFQKLKDKLPDPEKILAGDNFVPAQNDLRYALVAALVAHAEPKKHFGRLLEYTEFLPPEFSVLTVMMMVGKDEIAVGRTPGWDKWAKKHRDILLRRRSV